MLTFKTVGSMEWQDAGICKTVDPEMFFEEVKGSDNPAARKVCEGCPVKVKCLQYALDNNEEFGVWGGLTPPSRHKFARKYKRVTAENLNAWYVAYEKRKRAGIARRRQW